MIACQTGETARRGVTTQQRERNRRTLLEPSLRSSCAGTEGAQVSRRARGGPGEEARGCALLLVLIGLALALGANAASATPAPSFAAPKRYAVGKWPISVAIGDLNGDGTPEVAAIGDLNGDGRPDLVTADRDTDTVSVLTNALGLCAVQDVRRNTFLVARRTLARAHCRVGTVRRVYSNTVRRGRVISQRPKAYTVLPSGGRVNLVLSRGGHR